MSLNVLGYQSHARLLKTIVIAVCFRKMRPPTKMYSSTQNLDTDYDAITKSCLPPSSARKAGGSLRKSQLGCGFGRLILPKTDAQWILLNFVSCKAELPPKTREKTDFGLAQFVFSKNNCLLAYTPRGHLDTRRTSIIVDYSTRARRIGSPQLL